MGKYAILVLAALLILPGCGTRPHMLKEDQVDSIWVEDIQVPLTEEATQVLVREFNGAGYQRWAGSGPATHRLVLLTSSGEKFTLHRITEQLVEVGLRHGELRKKFFLTSPVLSELVRMISDVNSVKPGP